MALPSASPCPELAIAGGALELGARLGVVEHEHPDVGEGQLDGVDDLGRLLRQVHRILKPSMPLVLSMPHPHVDISPERPYGTGVRTIGEWFTALTRANFGVDHLLELGATAQNPAPIALILRARKEGS